MNRPDPLDRRCMPTAILMLYLLVAGCGGSETGTNQPAHVLGDVWAMTYPTTLALGAADHTYLHGVDQSGRTYDWMCFGESSDGEELTGARSDGPADLTVVGFMSSEAPCKWPLDKYLVVGVCHQCANRGLYYTGKTVSTARGYTFFEGIYGPYGIDDSGEFSMQSCLEAVPEWQGADVLMTTDEPDLDLLSATADHDPSKQSTLAVPPPLPASRRMRLNALMSATVNQQLGADFPESVVEALQTARNECLDAKADLDRRSAAGQTEPWHKVRAYEQLFNELADRYKKILTPDEYESLFNLPYDEPIDLSHFLPRYLP